MTSHKEAKFWADKHTIDKLGIAKIEGLTKADRDSLNLDPENFETIKKQEKQKDKKENAIDEAKENKKAKKLLKSIFPTIQQVLRKYCDLKEEYYQIIALWIIGTYIHDEFTSFPFLFINAMRGSGKSRLLKLIASLSFNGKVLADIRESVLFRTAKGSTICIDEFEGVGSKEKSTVRELLNAAYKKGTLVERMKKVSSKDGERFEAESFDLYTSIAMANIWGMDEVLEDRCISMVLERSNDKIKTRLIEDFENDDTIVHLKKQLSLISVVMCRVVVLKNITQGWNAYLLNNNTQQHTTHNNTQQQHDTNTTLSMFKKMDETSIDGRNIELFWALFVIAKAIGEKVFDSTLEISKEIVTKKKDDQFAESRDIAFIDFVSQQPSTLNFKPIVEISKLFRDFIGEIEDDDRWVNSKWVGQALKRLNLITAKKRIASGRQVVLNIAKAQEKIKIFKVVD